jgi:hypothetical protein
LWGANGFYSEEENKLLNDWGNKKQARLPFCQKNDWGKHIAHKFLSLPYD